MKEEKGVMKNSLGKENEPTSENGKKKTKEEKPNTKIVVRRLPATMTEDQFKMQVSPLPDIDYFYFVPADMSLTPHAFSRAYLNFVDQSDLFIFTQKFDGYVFIDSKGGEFPAVVEFAPFQRIPKHRPNRKKDPKVGTIESDPVFIHFKEQLEAESLENKTSVNVAKQHFFETSLEPERKEVVNTPLLDYLRNRRAERQRIRDEKREEKKKRDLERKRVKEEQRRTRKDEDSSVVKTPVPDLGPDPDPSPSKPASTSGSVSKRSENDEFPETVSKSDHEKQSSVKHFENDNKQKTEEVPTKICQLINFFNSPKSTHATENDNKRNFEEVPLKVREWVDLLNKSVHETSDNNFKKRNNSLPLCANHKDIESEIIKSGEKIMKQGKTDFGNLEILKNVEANNFYKPQKTKNVGDKINVQVLKSHSPRKNFYNYSNSPAKFLSYPDPAYYSSMRLVRSRGQGFVPRSNRPFSRNILVKPVEVSPPLPHTVMPKVSGTKEETEKDEVATDFSADVFRKNLQKVVENVLGSSENHTSNKSVITKPKTFVKRVLEGSGEQCAKPGFNSTSFYLPPRAFGCGPTKAEFVKQFSDFHEKRTLTKKQSPKTVCSGRGNEFSSINVSLPPFSKKYVSLSKSDGEIEKNETSEKVGGSEEILRPKRELRAAEGKSNLMRRPHVGLKRSFILEKTCKITP